MLTSLGEIGTHPVVLEFYRKVNSQHNPIAHPDKLPASQKQLFVADTNTPLHNFLARRNCHGKVRTWPISSFSRVCFLFFSEVLLQMAR